VARVSVPLLGLVAYGVVIAGIAAAVAVATVQLVDDDDNSPSLQDVDPSATPDDGLGFGETDDKGRAELSAQQFVYDFAARNSSSDEHAALTEGYSPRCEAQSLTDDGWLVRCELRHSDGRVFERIFDLVVMEDGTVSANAGGS